MEKVRENNQVWNVGRMLNVGPVSFFNFVFTSAIAAEGNSSTTLDLSLQLQLLR